VIEKYSETRRFWAKARLEVMARGGIGWNDLAGMDIEEFFYVLHVTEPKKKEVLPDKPKK
jgi:hypothetical protein